MRSLTPPELAKVKLSHLFQNRQDDLSQQVTTVLARGLARELQLFAPAQPEA
jgi:hypothetical protein